MSDVEVVLRAYTRLRETCLPPQGAPGTGGELTERQARILEQLDEDDPMMVTELAEYVGVTPSTMSLTLDRLERAGLVERSRDPDDRRVVNIRLTAEGTRLRGLMSALDPGRVDILLAALRPEDRRRALDGLALVAEAADAVVARRRRYVGALTGDGP